MSVILSEHLPLLASAPNGIQKLRGLILELAVRGKLVAQDPNDEPSSELLKRITEERDRVEASSSRRKSKVTTVISDANWPFELPAGWEWSRVGELATVVRGVSYEKSQVADNQRNGYLPLLRGHNINQTLNLDDLVFVPSDLISSDQLLRRGDIVIAMSSGSAHLVGKAAQVEKDIEGSFGAFCGVIRSFSTDLHRYFRFFFQTPLYRNRVAGHGKGIGINNLQKGALLSLECPIPPLAEQHRIIAKVDELMVLCDRLEVEQADSASAHARLVETLLGTLTKSIDAADLTANWQRLAEHFDILFNTETSIDALKQTILQLAVMGKLVPQNLNDEPVYQTFSGLKPMADVQDKSVGNGPAQWALCTYRSLTSLVTSGSRGWKDFYADSGAIFIRTQNIKTDRLVLNDVAFVNLPKSTEGMRSQVLKDDILITITGANVTKAARIESQIPEAYISQHIALTRPRWPAMSRWLHLCFISRGSARGTLEQLAYGAKPGLNLSNIRDLELPIPPLAEQHRVVAKVDELLALCDQLSTDLTIANQRQVRLANTFIESALEAA